MCLWPLPLTVYAESRVKTWRPCGLFVCFNSIGDDNWWVNLAKCAVFGMLVINMSKYFVCYCFSLTLQIWWPGRIRGEGAWGLFGPGLKLKWCLNFKRSRWCDHLHQRTFVEFKVDCLPKELLKKYWNLDSLGRFLVSPLHCVFLSVCPHQWLQMNEPSVCWHRLGIATV